MLISHTLYTVVFMFFFFCNSSSGSLRDVGKAESRRSGGSVRERLVEAETIEISDL